MDLLSQELTNIVSNADPRVVDRLKCSFFKESVSSSHEKIISNRDYYVENSNRIKKKKNRKNPCCRCGKIVSVANLKYHQTTEICQLGEEVRRIKINYLETFLKHRLEKKLSQ